MISYRNISAFALDQQTFVLIHLRLAAQYMRYPALDLAVLVWKFSDVAHVVSISRDEAGLIATFLKELSLEPQTATRHLESVFAILGGYFRPDEHFGWDERELPSRP